VVLSWTLPSKTSILYLSCDRQYLLNGRKILHADPCPMPRPGLGEMSLRGCSFEKILLFLKLCSTSLRLQQSCAQRLAAMSYRRRHYGDASSALQRILERAAK